MSASGVRIDLQADIISVAKILFKFGVIWTVFAKVISLDVTRREENV